MDVCVCVGVSLLWHIRTTISLVIMPINWRLHSVRRSTPPAVKIGLASPGKYLVCGAATAVPGLQQQAAPLEQKTYTQIQ